MQQTILKEQLNIKQIKWQDTDDEDSNVNEELKNEIETSTPGGDVDIDSDAKTERITMTLSPKSMMNSHIRTSGDVTGDQLRKNIELPGINSSTPGGDSSVYRSNSDAVVSTLNTNIEAMDDENFSEHLQLLMDFHIIIRKLLLNSLIGTVCSFVLLILFVAKQFEFFVVKSVYICFYIFNIYIYCIFLRQKVLY